MRQEELQDLLNSMSLQEKIDQMLQLTGDFYEDADSVMTGPAGELGVNEGDIRMAGSILGTAGAKKLKDIQKLYGDTASSYSYAFYDGCDPWHENHISHSSGTGCSF